MRLPDDPKREKLAILLMLFVWLPLSALIPATAQELPVLAVVLVFPAAGILLFGLLQVRRIPRLVLSGLIGGGLAGLVILGGGSRLAMRIVSLAGARREVTIDGTMFLLIFGTFAGANIGVMLAALRRVHRFRWESAAIVLGLLGLLVFFGPEETRGEIFNDGFGFWLNGPMFLALLPGYVWAALKAITFLDRKLPGRQRGRPLDRPADPGLVTSP